MTSDETGSGPIPRDGAPDPARPPVPFQDPGREVVELREALIRAVSRVARSGRFVLGPELEAFEAEAAGYLGVEHAVGVGSGTDALVLALRALEVGPGDEVVLPPFSFFATAEAVLRVGARPVFADVLPGTMDLDPSAAAEAITARTAALLPVHLYGQMADMGDLRALADRHGLALIEDAAQAFGASQRPSPPGTAAAPPRRPGTEADAVRRPGTFGDIACFSFYPTKNLGAWGDGGMVATRRPEVAERIRRLRDHGRAFGAGGACRGDHLEVGFNSRLDELQAAVLRVKLPHLRAGDDRRREHAGRYDEALRGVEGVSAPVVRSGNRHVYHQYTVRCPERELLVRRLDRHGIGHAVYYRRPLHLLEALRPHAPGPGAFPEAERAAREVVSLPVFPALREEERRRVMEALTDA